MNRREFLKTLFSGVVGSALIDVDQLLLDTQHLPDTDFIQYITIQFQLFVTNPRQCAYIDGITWEES